MAFLAKIFSYVWAFLTIFAPFASILWGTAIYAGIGYSIYAIYNQCSTLVGNLNVVFGQWANTFSVSFTEIFGQSDTNSFLQLGYYLLSLDVPFEWFRSCIDAFLRFWLSSICGIMLGGIEICVVALAVYFARSRIKKISMGMNGGGS